jgi:hypothetical protein
VGALDFAPRPADYVARLRPIGGAAFKLLNSIEGLDTWTREAVTIKLRAITQIAAPRQFAKLGRQRIEYPPVEPYDGPNTIEQVSKALVCLADACITVIREKEKLSSKGAPTRSASRIVASELQKLFAEQSQGWSRQRDARGALQKLSPYEAKERAFIATALSDAKIPVPSDLKPRERTTATKKVRRRAHLIRSR